ncbi:MAG TPA: hypothetical protein VHL34_23565 [Rhizomicrobium sp.]|jgi:hypothetical protein|nr:hypothetical protein [Rhizomicrobium sp.]
MSIHYPTTEVPGSRALYGAIVAGAAFLVIASISSIGPTVQLPAQPHAAKAPTTIETVVVTAGQST